jgi:hypothetical protein
MPAGREPANRAVKANAVAACATDRGGSTDTVGERWLSGAARWRRPQPAADRSARSRRSSMSSRSCLAGVQGRSCREQGPLLRGAARRLELARHNRTGRQGRLAGLRGRRAERPRGGRGVGPPTRKYEPGKVRCSVPGGIRTHVIGVKGRPGRAVRTRSEGQLAVCNRSLSGKWVSALLDGSRWFSTLNRHQDRHEPGSGADSESPGSLSCASARRRVRRRILAAALTPRDKPGPAAPPTTGTRAAGWQQP